MFRERNRVFYEVERITTAVRRFCVRAESQEDAERMVKRGEAQAIKNCPDIDQILYGAYNTVSTIRSAETAEEINPHVRENLPVLSASGWDDAADDNYVDEDRPY